MGTISVLSKTLSPALKGCKWDFFDRKRLEPRELSWQWHHRCHFGFVFVMYNSCAKFNKDYGSNIARDILDSVFYHFSGTV